MNKRVLQIIAYCLLAAMLLSACGKADSMDVLEPQETAAPESTPEPDLYAGTLRISEVMTKNGAVLLSSDGSFHDWLEIENISSGTVPLDGWSIKKNGKTFEIQNGTVLEPGSFTLVFATGDMKIEETFAACKLAQGDMVSLVSPGGTESETVECFEERENYSIALNEDGLLESCEYPTPGAVNTVVEFDRLNGERTTDSPLIISELTGKNADTAKCNTGYEDWIELLNVSSSEVLLSDFYLSDKESEPFLFQLPEQTLAPGERFVIWCSGSTKNTKNTGERSIHSNFKISGSGESIYLSTESGFADYVAYRNIPTDWSMGREDGSNVWVLFSKPTPGDSNVKGFSRMSAQPEALTQPGAYDDVESISVELSGSGTIYYTVDGSVPTVGSKVYSEPITIKKTTIVRCICEEEGLAPSTERTLTYVINQGHELPVLSLVVDDYSAFKNLYYNATLNNRPVGKELSTSLTLYEDGEVFSQRGSVSMKGWTSLDLPKKSMGVDFSGAYGNGAIKCDLYGEGVNKYEKLSIRAGQDYTFAVIRNELIQELCLEATDNVPTQHSKYCALYINGNYWGLYCLKEDVSIGFYANWAGVEKDAVVKSKSPVTKKSKASKEFMKFCRSNDLTKKENYDYFCSIFDIDNLIDWMIIEGFSANTDINGNMRYFRTDTGKWQIVLYDCDWSLKGYVSGKSPFQNVLYEDRVEINKNIISQLMKNEEFSKALYARAEELFGSVLSNEHVLEKIDELAAVVESEIPRDRAKWNLYADSWYMRVNELKDFITTYNWDESCLKALRKALKIK